MSSSTDWAFPASVQPTPEETRFDLEAALESVVKVHADIPDDAFTASILGTEREGNGIVIRDDGLILTIGYLITEAQSIWLTTNDGTVVPAHPVAYDQATGFGLVQPLAPLRLPRIETGSTAALAVGDEVIVIGHGGRAHALKARVVAKREFAGYWEYVLDEAIFTSPPHPQWGGSALVGDDGRLLGVGSLLVEELVGDEKVDGNMFVPIDLLGPILDDLLRFGRSARPPRPWLGMYAMEDQGHLVISGLARGGPAESAGVQLGDIVVAVADERISGLADLFRRVWRSGPAGTEIALSVARDGELVRVRIRSADRGDFLKKPQLH